MTDTLSLQPTTLLRATRDQVSCTLGDEAVILQTQDGIYYGLDTIGARVWELLQEPVTLAALIGQLVQEYDVTDEQCRQDLTLLLGDMHAKKLIIVDAA